MIVRLILLIAFVIAVITIVRIVQHTPKSQLKTLYWKIGLSALAIALVFMAVTGRIHWIGALIAAVLPFIRQLIPTLIRYFPLIQQLRRSHQTSKPASGGNSSKVATSILQMVLDHDSNTLSGEVISGPFKGKSLDSLSLEQLITLLDYCQQQDHDSEKLLVSYLNHRFGNSWQNAQQQNASDQSMTREEACAILGVSPDASKEAIIAAHRKLMQKVHPDRGGNDYLAAKINLAKDLLIG